MGFDLRTISRRHALLGAGAFTAAFAVSSPGWAKAGDALVTTANGRLRGLRAGGISIFRGIPYGGSVSGSTRFKAPTPPPSWTGVRDAIRLGAPSIQPPHQTRGINEPLPAEDCLFLNVWTPATDGKRRPVMFYSHGGGFTVGSGGAIDQDGSELARKYNVVVVESNHRLGLLGYLYLKDLLGPDYVGNQGMLDILAALKWVNTNISAFGGDPDNVMIFGESGGGMKTSILYTMPAAAPYFHKASIESSFPLVNCTPEAAMKTTRDVLDRLGISPANAHKILEVPAAALLGAQMGKAGKYGPGTVPPPGTHLAGKPPISFRPTVDGTIIPEAPFENHAPAISATKPLIIGGCKDETVFFYRLNKSVFTLDEAGLKARLTPMLHGETDDWIHAFKRSRPDATPSELFVAITTARPMHAYNAHVAEMKAEQGTAPVYAYCLDYHSKVKIPGTDFEIGSPHASDIEMKFDTARVIPKGFFYNEDRTEARFKTADNMSQMWATFAHTGKPGAKGQPEWAQYDLSRRATMLISAQCRLADDSEGLERKFWESRRYDGFQGFRF